jgi:hypothetical protein
MTKPDTVDQPSEKENEKPNGRRHPITMENSPEETMKRMTLSQSVPPNSKRDSVPLEKRTRVEIFLPIRTESGDYRAITHWLAEELAYSRGGSTMTSPFTGLYVFKHAR